MKLVEIKDVRPGQVWINDQTGLIHTVDDLGELSNADKMETAKIRDKYLKSAKCRLIGKLGITHRIEDNKLIKNSYITEFQIDDVVCHESGKIGVIVKINNVGFAIGYEYSINCGDEGFNDTFEYITKIGTLGVTHEFVNDMEASGENS